MTKQTSTAQRLGAVDVDGSFACARGSFGHIPPVHWNQHDAPLGKDIKRCSDAVAVTEPKRPFTLRKA